MGERGGEMVAEEAWERGGEMFAEEEKEREVGRYLLVLQWTYM